MLMRMVRNRKRYRQTVPTLLTVLPLKITHILEAAKI